RESKSDLYAAFVERGVSLSAKYGKLGAITSRTGFFISTLQQWREALAVKRSRVTPFADLCYGVLGTALVETAAYCLSIDEDQKIESSIQFIRACDYEESSKGECIAQSLRSWSDVYFASYPDFRCMEGSPFVYFVSNTVRRIFQYLPSFES